MRIFDEIKYQMRYGLPVWFFMLATSWLPDISIFVRLRGWVVSIFLPGRPKGLLLGRDVTLLSIDRLFIGEKVYLAKGTWINAIGGVFIENEVVIAPYCVMSSNNHGFKDGSVQRGGAHPAPIKIRFGSWLAAHSVLTAGVVVGRGNIIGANSVVTRSTEDDGIYAGVPAKRVKERVDNPSEITSKHDVKVELG
ncbi:acyltransferase [Vibrio diabolicus]|uniref:acyltransferase n=1 Tax=Vibrio TaxID=662 RepID=UPI001DD3EFAB|nr:MULTISPECIES: acyltransferase [Vibrio]EGR1221768.1 acyltransferase [Vibrio parahaemolyticus]EGR2323351.1 acyltransferase [Vibrio alginolyticus]MDW1807866.1 acyltransferase [Vibrio sp. Vb2362]EIZ0309215.1 acyltransferase [Vibrio parahaemolyticus]ELA6649971.1 acyltransferase [Vibrio alginolyticus]